VRGSPAIRFGISAASTYPSPASSKRKAALRPLLAISAATVLGTVGLASPAVAEDYKTESASAGQTVATFS